MSKHWNPRDVQGGGRKPYRRGRSGPLPDWAPAPARSAWRPTAMEVRLTLLIGLFLGFAYAMWSGAARDEAPQGPVTVPDYWAESKRSKEILREQEGAPPSALPGEARGDSAIVGVGVGDAVDVIDGDTFRIDGATIRIADIDTPEVDGRCASETELAARATRRIAALLAAGPFELEPVGWRDEDQYGRKLRIVTRNGHSLGDQLVEEGLARTWTGRREPWC